MDVLSDTQEDQETALRMKAWLKAVGIDMNIQVATEDAINAQIYHSTNSKSPADKGKYEPTYDAFMWGWGGDLTTPDYNFEVMTCSNTSADAQWCNPEFSKLTADALHEKNFQKRVDMLHEAEKLELEASPYVVYAYTPYISVTRTDTWTDYTPSPQPGGQPFGMNWLQLQLIVPGDEISSNYAGTGVRDRVHGRRSRCWWSAISRWQRWREEREPFELRHRAADAVAAGAGAAVRFVLSKCAVALGTLIFVLVFNFFLFRVAGDPIKDLIRGNPHLTEQGRERLIKERGLDDSYITQFRIYVDEVAHGDLGTSFQTNQPVSTMIWAALPNTLILVGSSTILAVIIGTWLGIVAAANRGSPGDTGVVQGSLFFYAMPDFWAGMILIWLFAVVLGLFPTGLKIGTRGQLQRPPGTPGTSPSTRCCRSSR